MLLLLPSNTKLRSISYSQTQQWPRFWETSTNLPLLPCPRAWTGALQPRSFVPSLPFLSLPSAISFFLTRKILSAFIMSGISLAQAQASQWRRCLLFPGWIFALFSKPWLSLALTKAQHTPELCWGCWFCPGSSGCRVRDFSPPWGNPQPPPPSPLQPLPSPTHLLNQPPGTPDKAAADFWGVRRSPGHCSGSMGHKPSGVALGKGQTGRLGLPRVYTWNGNFWSGSSGEEIICWQLISEGNRAWRIAARLPEGLEMGIDSHHH